MKKNIALFSVTFIFLLFFSGYLLYMSIYAPLEMYEVHYFTGDHFPTKTEILFSGFRSPSIIVYSVITALIHILFIRKFVSGNIIKRSIPDLLLRSITIALFLASLYFISHLLTSLSTWPENKRALLHLLGQYFTITIIFLLCTGKRNTNNLQIQHNP